MTKLLTLRIPVVTVHGESSQVVLKLKEPDSIECWYAEILHGVIPVPWLNAWVHSRAHRPSGRFDGVVLSTGTHGQVLLTIAPEIVDHPFADEELAQLLSFA